MTEATTTRRYQNLFFLSNFDRDDHAVAEAMSAYDARSYADVDYTDPAALLREAQIEYDHVWRNAEDFDINEQAEVTADEVVARGLVNLQTLWDLTDSHVRLN
jgi:hypothetical protein